ncbi:TetR family transcriptional regulator [Novosphingobium soli]|uniref:TetR family transcriptional regulator n=1 Tax=Novosphingobium soli TaxID=574956 RepID=A0ABV6CYN6_9SPHN
MIEACWTCGSSNASVRSLAARADAPISSIYHHFGSMEQLYVSAQEHALALARAWCDQQRTALAALPRFSAHAFAPLMAALIDDFCEAQRAVAFAWRDCELMAARSPRHAPLARRWAMLWTEFWSDLSARAGLGDHSALTTHFFQGESLLHLMQWQRTIDRPCLEETCAGWVLWLEGRLAPGGEWRRFGAEQAHREMPPLTAFSGTMERIADTAADIVAEQGISGLTHRAVAARANLTLGVISHNCHSSADLVRAAFETIYRRTVASSAPGDLAQEGPDQPSEFDPLPPHSPEALLCAMDELLLAVARNPSLRPFAPQLRYWRGRTSGKVLEAMLAPDRVVSPRDAALFSAMVAGMRKWSLGLDEGAATDHRKRCMAQVAALLRDGKDRM